MVVYLCRVWGVEERPWSVGRSVARRLGEKDTTTSRTHQSQPDESGWSSGSGREDGQERRMEMKEWELVEE